MIYSGKELLSNWLYKQIQEEIRAQKSETFYSLPKAKEKEKQKQRWLFYV